MTVELPDRVGRRDILDVHADCKRLGPDVDLDALAGLTPGFSGADLANVLNEAALLAARRRQPVVTMALVEEAVERSMLGVSSRGQAMSDEQRRMVAYHEAGHALVGHALPGGRVPHKLSVVARGKALGFTWHTDAAERALHSRSALLDEIATLLGGRVAEQLIFDEPGTGAADDLARASRIARRMVCELGMSDALGSLSYERGAGAQGGSFSDDTARAIDAEVRALVDKAYQRAHTILTGSRAALTRVAEALVEHETLTAEDFESLVAKPARRKRAPASAT